MSGGSGCYSRCPGGGGRCRPPSHSASHSGQSWAAWRWLLQLSVWISTLFFSAVASLGPERQVRVSCRDLLPRHIGFVFGWDSVTNWWAGLGELRYIPSSSSPPVHWRHSRHGRHQNIFYVDLKMPLYKVTCDLTSYYTNVKRMKIRFLSKRDANCKIFARTFVGCGLLTQI